MTSIGVDVFHSCLVLISIEVNSNNINYASVDGVLFNKLITTLIKYPAGKTQTTYSIPSSVTSIITNAFQSCTFITSVTIPVGVTSIGQNAFYLCTSLTAVTIPSSVTSIGSGAFYECSSLTTATIPVGVTSIGAHAFQ